MKRHIAEILAETIEEIAGELHGIRVALAERIREQERRINILENEVVRHERLLNTPKRF